MRQVAWAKTFGLPLELLSPEQAQELFPLMVTDGVRCASYLADRRLSRPLAADLRARRRRPRGRLPGVHAHARERDRRRRRPGPRREHRVGRCRGRDRRQRRRDVRRRDRPDGRGAGAGGSVRPRVPRDPAVSRARGGPGPIHLPTLRDPDLLIYFREEGGGLVMGGYERHSAPWSLDEHSLDRIPADFNGRLLEEDWPRFEEIAGNSARRVPDDGGRQGHAADQRPGGVHARQRVLPRRDRGPRIVRRRRLLRPRPRRRRRDGQG